MSHSMKRNAQNVIANQKKAVLTQTQPSQLSTVIITVGGQRISVKTDKDEGYLMALAEEVNDCINEMKTNAPSASLVQMLALASIHFADKLHEAHHQLDSLKTEVMHRSDRIMKMLDDEDAGSLDVKE